MLCAGVDVAEQACGRWWHCAVWGVCWHRDARAQTKAWRQSGCVLQAIGHRQRQYAIVAGVDVNWWGRDSDPVFFGRSEIVKSIIRSCGVTRGSSILRQLRCAIYKLVIEL